MERTNIEHFGTVKAGVREALAILIQNQKRQPLKKF
jgi:hypothetical protein